jgi:hypothetical protein
MYSETPKLGRWRRLDSPTTAMVRLFLRIWLMESPAECADAPPFESLPDPTELFMETDQTFRVRSGFRGLLARRANALFLAHDLAAHTPVHKDKKPCKSGG